MDQSPIEPSSLGQQRTLLWHSIPLAILATLGFGYLAFGGLEVATILQAISRVSAWAIVGAVSLFLGAVTLRITRWWLLMRNFQPDLHFATCAKPFLLSIAANDFMPLRIGDLVKMFANQEQIKVNPSTRLGTIIVERLFDIISILLVFFIGVHHLNAPALVSWLPAAYGVLTIAISSLFLVLFCSKTAERWCHALLNLKPFRNRKLFRQGKEWVSQFFKTFSELKIKRLAGLFLLSCAIWGIEGSMALSLAWAIDPATGALGPYLSLACGALSNLLPSAPLQAGTLDYFLTLGVRESGMREVDAAAFALLVHILFLGFSAMAAALLLSRKSTWIMLRVFSNKKHESSLIEK